MSVGSTRHGRLNLGGSPVCLDVFGKRYLVRVGEAAQLGGGGGCVDSPFFGNAVDYCVIELGQYRAVDQLCRGELRVIAAVPECAQFRLAETLRDAGTAVDLGVAVADLPEPPADGLRALERFFERRIEIDARACGHLGIPLTFEFTGLRGFLRRFGGMMSWAAMAM